MEIVSEAMALSLKEAGVNTVKVYRSISFPLGVIGFSVFSYFHESRSVGFR